MSLPVTLLRSLPVAAVATFLASMSTAQLPLRPNQGYNLFELEAVPTSSFGRQVAGCGDVDADGCPDWLIGAPFDATAGTQSGRAVVVSGRTGLEIHRLDGSPFSQLGWSIMGLGDLDQDGHADFAVTALVSGVIRIYSGKRGGVLREVSGDANEERFGWSLACLGDWDGDGATDFACSSQSGNYPYTGRVRVVSARDGRLLFQMDDPAVHGLGSTLAAAGDVDRDGYADLLVRSQCDASGNANRPLVSVISGRSGVLLRTLVGGEASFGTCVVGAFDLDKDGYDDVAVGSPRGSAQFEGRFEIYSGRTGQLLLAAAGATPFEDFGTSIACLGDIDEDGSVDFVVGAPSRAVDRFLAVGRTCLLSGRDGRVLREYWGRRTKGHFGSSVAAAEDLNGDHAPDFVVGAPSDGSTYRDAEGFIGGRVQALSSAALSLSSDGHVFDSPQRTRRIDFDAGVANAGKAWLLLGSLSGVGPTRVLGFDLPLSIDAYTSFLLSAPNSVLPTVGILDAAGRDTRTLHAPAWPTTAFHAFVVLDFQSLTICCPSVAIPMTVLRR